MAVSRIQSQAEARETLAQMEGLKRRAARQALRNIDKAEVPRVECTILPMGDGKISMGEHFAAIGDAHFEEGETAEFELPVALSLYQRGFVTFEDAKQALEDAREAQRHTAREAAEARRRAQEEADAA